MNGMREPQVEVKPVPHLSDDELKLMLKVTEGRSFMDRRDHAIIRLYIDTGMRAGALAGMKVEDVDLDAQQVTITTKGRKTLKPSFGDKAALALDRYLRERRKHNKASDQCLWLGPKGRLTESGIAQMLSRRASQAGLGHINPHQFRHTFAHRWMAAGGAESDLQNTVGWSSTQMIQRYGASAKAERAQAAARRLALGDNL